MDGYLKIIYIIMITEDYVSFETAKLLKEKGFDADIDLWYNSDGEIFHLYHYDYDATKYFACVQCPTLQMAMKWLKDIHNLDIITPPQFDNINWTYSAIIVKLSIPCTEIRLNDNKNKKEEACEAAIKYCLENLI